MRRCSNVRSRLERETLKGHGGDILDVSERTGIPAGDILDFSYNVNPLGPPAGVKAAAIAALDSLTRYPDDDCRALRTRLAEVHGLPADRLLVGNGSTELIYLLPRALGARRVALFSPSYMDYWRASQLAGAEVTGYACSDENGFRPAPELLDQACLTADMVWLGNPNNPNGGLLDRDMILRASMAHPRTVFVVDEAFMEFTPDPDRYTLLRDGLCRNVIVLRSLTKFFALPGLRLGFLTASPEIVRLLQAAKEPWTVNAIALAVGERLYDDPHYMIETRRLIGQERDFLLERLLAIGAMYPFPSRANFILARIERSSLTAPQLKQGLLQDRILIRDASNFRGLGGRYVRFAVRLREDNERLLSALSRAFASTAA
jgi:L-threonine-O-3-phosphate decarboxylase